MTMLASRLHDGGPGPRGLSELHRVAGPVSCGDYSVVAGRGIGTRPCSTMFITGNIGGFVGNRIVRA